MSVIKIKNGNSWEPIPIIGVNTTQIEQNTSDIANLKQNAVTSSAVRNVVVLTQTEYNALATKDANTEYNIIGA